MKKLLIGTTALAAVAMMTAPGAQAAEKISLGLGGFSKVYVGSASNTQAVTVNGATTPNGFHNIDVKSNSEVYFKGSTTLDNGLTVGAHIQLETDRPNRTTAVTPAPNQTTTSPARIDHNYVHIGSASMGTLSLGSTFGPATSAMVGVSVPDASGVGLDAGFFGQWVVKPTAVTSMGHTILSTSDNHGVKYVSPSFGGVTIGLGLMPQADGNDPIAKANDAAKQTQASLAYNGEFSGVGVKAALGWSKSKRLVAPAAPGDTADQKGLAYGLNVSFSGFTVGATMMKNTVTRNFANSNNDGKTYLVGAGYTTGPITVTATYMVDKYDRFTANTKADKSTQWALAGKYNMGPGVDASLAYMNAKYTDGIAAGATPVAGNNNKGSAIIAGLQLAF